MLKKTANNVRNIRMKTNSKLLLIAAALSAISARADLIDVNFYSSIFGGSAASGAAVVGTASDQWNGFDGDSGGGGGGSLIDASGNATSASLSFSSLSAVLAATANFQPNGSLMSQYIYS
jgi:opacity protein-like surface antigen